jgi:fibronectin type 3 domain-containing protein/regulation of enolase protein 1 (concanavalin A-like superfamily)
LNFKLLQCIVALTLFVGSLVAAPGGYLFVTFQNGSTPQAEQIYFGLSQDGQTWTALNGSKPVLVSHLGEKGVRDPYILRSHDGSKFYLIATDLSIYYNGDWTRAQQAGSHSILVWESSDLVNWSQPRLVAVAASDAGCTWAPEAVYDESTGDYLVFWASTSASDGYAKQRIWASRTTDFKTFSAPFIYIERANHVIDADIINDGSHYYRFTKDETTKAITMETSDQLLGTWTNVAGFTLASLQGYEGPECYQLANGDWCLIADHYSAGTGYAPFVTSDLASGSFAAGTGFSFPFPFRHGAVLPLSTEEYARLSAAYQSSSRIVIHLPFNETSGTTSADVAGHAWDATLVGGASRVAGKGGNAVSLSGSSQYVSLPTGALYALTDFTISAWVKINTLSQWSRVFDFGTGTSKYLFLTPKAGGTGNVRFAITTSGGGGEQKIDGTAPLPTGAWTHVAVSVQGSLGILYVNGVEVGRNAAMTLNPSLLTATTQNWLGRSQFSGDPYLDGAIDDFRVYSGGLSASAIQALSNDGAPGVLASPWLDQDLGAPALAGSAGTGEGGYTGISAGGAGIQGAADEGHFIYRSWTGDGILTTRLDTVSANASSAANAGLMIRNDLTDSAPCLYLGMTQTGTLTWQHRDSAGSSTTATAGSTTPAAPWLRITRYGNVFTAYTSADGSTWTQVGSPVTLALQQSVQVGMAMSSGSSTALETARFTSASIATPPAPATPGDLVATSDGTRIQLSWTGVPGASSYTIKRSTSANGTFTTVASGILTTSYTDSPTANGTWYYVVTGSNSGGESAASTAASAQVTSAAATSVYVFSTFTGDGAEDMKLRIYVSVDGIHFSLYSITGYGGPTGSLRDPSIMKYSDGRYYLVFTAPPYNKPYANQNFVGLAWSTDLQTWHTMPNISTTGVPGVKVSWAPEWVVDGSGVPKFTVNCSSTASDLRPYLYTATSSDLTSWSGPVDIGIGSTNLDVQVLKVGDTWHCFTKTSMLRHATAPSITGPWTYLPDRSDWANLEGPCAVQLTDGSWMMQVDPMYDVAQYMTSPDINNWSPLMYWPGMSGVKHGTVIRDDAFNLPPGGLAATPGNGSVTLQWNAFPGATSYTVKRASASGGPYAAVATVTGTSFTDLKLANGSTYYYEVSMNSGGAESSDSAPVSVVPAMNVVTLAHRYSFSETSGTTVADSVGGSAWNGTLPNGGTLGGGQVQLRASSSQYVNLPAGILGSSTAVTIEAWVTFPSTLPTNCWFFGFGNISGASGSGYVFCQPKSGRIAITSTNYSGEQNTAPNPSGNWSNQTNLHVTAVFDPSQGRLALYTNGTLVAQSTSVTTPLSAINNVVSYIGRSFYSGDPYIDFNLNEFRIYNGAFTSNDIAATESLGPDQVITPTAAPSGVNASASGTNIQLSWTGVSGATSYTIKRSTSPGGTFATVVSGITTTSYTDSPTADGTTYYYVVTGVNSTGEGSDSSAASTTLYSDYQQWKMASGLDVNIADSATPGSDGTPVLLKYAIGAAPGAAVNAPFTPVTTPSRGISFTRLSPARAKFVVQASSDLGTWADIATLAFGSDTWTGPATVDEDASVTPRQVTVHDDPAFDTAAKRFFRLQVQRNVP